MDLKERLDRLTSLSKKETPSKSEILGDLRGRLDRLLEPKKVYRKREAVPIEQLVRGEVVSTPHGEAFQARTSYPPEFQCGRMTFSEILSVPTYPAHLLTRDEQLKELDLRKTLFVDTETTGLSGGTGTFAFMIGAGFFEGETFHIHQWFMRDFSEEKASLSLFGKWLESFQYLVTFNGRNYDVPLLETRFILARTPSGIRGMPNFDLLFPSRKIWKGAYENCRLVTLESKLLGMEREDDIASEFIPYLYFDYLRTGDAQKIHRVFYHNQMDILAMVGLTGRIHLVYHDPQAARPRKGIEHFALGRLFWDHGHPEKALDCFEVALHRCDEDLTWEVMKWLSRAMKKTGQLDRARSLWEEMSTWPDPRDVFPYVELAKFYEHRAKDIDRAMSYVEQGLKRALPHQHREIEGLSHRKRRLEQKRSGDSG
jgi:uncharacterized protein YprB with RNaseH-like and TPR domain